MKKPNRRVAARQRVRTHKERKAKARMRAATEFAKSLRRIENPRARSALLARSGIAVPLVAAALLMTGERP